MQRDLAPSGCGCCSLNRRRFLAGCASCAAGVAGLTVGARSARGAELAGKPKIRLVYSYIPSTTPIWPNIGYDFDKRKKELTTRLAKACPGVEFVPVTMHNADDAGKILAADKEVAGYLIYTLGIWTGQVTRLTATGKPTVLVDDLYGGSGEWLISHSAAKRASQKVVGVSTSRFEDVAAIARCFEMLAKPDVTTDAFTQEADRVRRSLIKPAGKLKCDKDEVKVAEPGEVMKRLKESTMLVVGAPNPSLSQSITERFGVKVVPVDFKVLDAAWAAADKDESASWADRWMKDAAKVIEPTRDDVLKSGAMYVAMRELLKKHNAQAITINCLGGFYSQQLHAYPCLGFTQFNNDGLVGACEADQVSTITMMVLNYLTGRPTYISDPVIDTSRNQIIYAHCVAPTKVFGTSGKTNPYHIRSHSEDRKGAVVRSLLPLGYMTSSLEFHPIHKQVIFHQGKAVANIDEDMACRTKLAVEVKGDIEKLTREWDRFGWHRVTVYGDVAEPVAELAKALKLDMVYEA